MHKKQTHITAQKFFEDNEGRMYGLLKLIGVAGAHLIAECKCGNTNNYQIARLKRRRQCS